MYYKRMNDTNNTTQPSGDASQPLWLRKGDYTKTDIDFRTIKASQKVWTILLAAIYLPLVAWILIRKNSNLYRQYNGAAYVLNPHSSMRKTLVFIAALGTIVYSFIGIVLVLYIIAVAANN